MEPTVGSGLAVAAPGIVLENEDNLIPDAVWMSAERLASAMWPDGKLHELPELVVEVLSPGTTNVQRDREEKPSVYARLGVLEYWLVDWPARRMEIFRLSDAGSLDLATILTETDFLSSPLLPGFEHPMGRLFIGVPHGQP
jgi:Uma2 family endonuclease